MASAPLYEDSFVTVGDSAITISMYYWPIPFSRTVRFDEIAGICYTATLPMMSYRAWGVGCTPIW